MDSVITNIIMTGTVELSCIFAILLILCRVVSLIDNFLFDKVLILTHSS